MGLQEVLSEIKKKIRTLWVWWPPWKGRNDVRGYRENGKESSNVTRPCSNIVWGKYNNAEEFEKTNNMESWNSVQIECK